MALKSWLPIPDDSHFSLANIPFGIIRPPSSVTPRPAIAIGNYVLDLEVFSSHGGFAQLPFAQAQIISVFSQPTLNDFAALGRPFHREVRRYLQNVLSDQTSYPHILKENSFLRETALLPLQSVQICLPMRIGAYTDFFAGKNHAYNCGVIFRGVENALQPNYLHLPVGYSSRASSVVPSGTSIRRPLGQILEDPTIKKPVLAPCRRLDIELELGVFLCKPNKMGEPISIQDAEDHLFGVVLLNDWSARDIQTWEAVPLGPFNAKNFGSSVSTWVVLMDALEPFKVEGITNEVELLPHLQEKQKKNVYDINLKVNLTTNSGQTATLAQTNGRNLVFSFAQMLAHHTIGGCPMEVGDLLGSGTISGTEPGTYGSLLEATNGGKEVIKLAGGIERKFLEDGDTVTIHGWCGGDGSLKVGFGECWGKICPSPQIKF